MGTATLDGFSLPSKRMLIQVHNEQRALERYGIPLTAEDAASMSEQCRDQRGTFLARTRKCKSLKIWLVWWPSANRIVPVYYSNKKRAIVSVLPAQLADKIIRRTASADACDLDDDVSVSLPTLMQPEAENGNV